MKVLSIKGYSCSVLSSLDVLEDKLGTMSHSNYAFVWSICPGWKTWFICLNSSTIPFLCIKAVLMFLHIKLLWVVICSMVLLGLIIPPFLFLNRQFENWRRTCSKNKNGCHNFTNENNISPYIQIIHQPVLSISCFCCAPSYWLLFRISLFSIYFNYKALKMICFLKVVISYFTT
jgi:hypothetical protein